MHLPTHNTALTYNRMTVACLDTLTTLPEFHYKSLFFLAPSPGTRTPFFESEQTRVILPKSCLRKQTYIFVFSPTQKTDHIPWPTARAQLCETTQMLRVSLQPRTQMIVTPCVHHRPCKHKLASFRRRRHAPEFPGFWVCLGHKCQRDPLNRWRCCSSVS